MTTSASIIADSINPVSGNRLTTFVLRYHRYIHGEFMTHRQASRNASSSRAIPSEKFIEWVKEDPAMPVRWQKNVRGMQGGADLEPAEEAKAKEIWLRCRDLVIGCTNELLALNVHKQIANRMLEPWHHITVVATATNWANVFALRCHKDAQPEFQELAVKMLREYRRSKPQALTVDRGLISSWHLPFITEDDKSYLTLEQLISRSVARCARTSYNNHDGTKNTIEQDQKLFDMLLAGKPLHASPAEHIARAAESIDEEREGKSGNFHRSWVQFRKTLGNECVWSINDLDPAILALVDAP